MNIRGGFSFASKYLKIMYLRKKKRLETWYYYSHVLMASEKQRPFFSFAKVLIFFQAENRNRNKV